MRTISPTFSLDIYHVALLPLHDTSFADAVGFAGFGTSALALLPDPAKSDRPAGGQH